MANDPNRDLLPVKEDCCKSGKGYNGKFDYQLLGKLSRCELEDRFLRLQDEQTHIKKLANCQEEKIKRLGTKLLRLINEKKIEKKFAENKETEDLHLRIIELEHENYALKDKNTVLKQQLSSHSRNLSTQRSPNRSNHTSPLITMRQSALQTNCESNYEDASKTAAAEMQLQEAEAHIRELNDEIKCLHKKIDFLQQNVEKNSLDSRKIKVTENIELIRLQRSLKQQAIQIAALQAQIKNSENNQKMLKEELTKAHNENDEALHLISIKQNEILNLCSKLEEENLNRLQEDELKSRVHDLMRERDCLKERSDCLMKTIAAKTEENEKIIELQKLLAEEKCQKGKLEETLELLRKNYPKGQGPFKESPKSLACINTVSRAQQTVDAATDGEMLNSVGEISEGTDDSCQKCHLCLSFCKCSQESFMKSELDSDTDLNDCIQEKRVAQKFGKDNSLPVDKYFAEKMKLERELQYLREMLRSQTCRCEAQQAEINRLMYEIKLNEEKCNETLHRLDWHLKIFQTFEMSEFEAIMKFKQNERLSKATGEPVSVKSDPAPKKSELKESPRPVKPIESEKALLTREYVKSGSYGSRDLSPSKRKLSKSEEPFPPKFTEKSDITVPEKETTVQRLETKRNNRFVDQKFLDSSDEEPDNSETFNRSYMRALKKSDSDDSAPLDFKNQDSDHIENQLHWYRQAEKPQKVAPDKNPFNWTSKRTSDVSFKAELKEKDAKKDSKVRALKQEMDEFYDDRDRVAISVLWFEIQSKSSLSKNNRVEMIFIDFAFLNVNGVETETPQSLPKPRSSKEKCSFNFTRSITLSEIQKTLLASTLKEPDSVLITFKVVSDSERLDDTNGVCEDVGIAVVTVKEFLNMCNKSAFNIHVKNVENGKEIVGTLAVKIDATPGLLVAVGHSGGYIYAGIAAGWKHCWALLLV